MREALYQLHEKGDFSSLKLSFGKARVGTYLLAVYVTQRLFCFTSLFFFFMNCNMFYRLQSLWLIEIGEVKGGEMIEWSDDSNGGSELFYYQII